MLFKDVKVGYPLFILNRADMNFSKAEVVSVGTPYFPPVNNASHMIGAVPNIQRIVDITVCKNGENHLYSTNDSSEICYSKDEVIATDKSFILNEIRTAKKNFEIKISRHENDISMLEKCSSLLAELDDEERERQHNEKRLDVLEKSINKLSENMNEFMCKILKKKEHEVY